MSKSRKKAIVKDHGRRKDWYWRVHRRVNKILVNYYCKVNLFVNRSKELTLKLPKELINDYDYCDWIFDAEYSSWKDSSNKEKWSRK